jgi:hypothetical protein
MTRKDRIKALFALAAVSLAASWFGGQAGAQTECPPRCVELQPAPMPLIDASPFRFCTKSGTMMIGDKCIDLTLNDGGGSISAAPMPMCPEGYALLTYPGTWTPICAHDLRAPK